MASKNDRPNLWFASAEDYRAAAERRITSAEAAQGLPIVIGTDDTYYWRSTACQKTSAKFSQ